MAIESDKFIVCATFHYFALVHDTYKVGIAYRR